MLGGVDASFVSQTFSAKGAEWASSRQRPAAAGGSANAAERDPEVQRKIEQFKARDAEVRAHEAAHVAAGGNLVQGGASFTYVTGPDGKRYASGGEVSIDVSKGRDARETLSKADQIRRAALAPADPSPQDYQVAAQAARMALEASAELATQAREKANAGDGRASSSSALAAYRDAADAFSGFVGGLISARA
ncbi:putative metalloprotease CJM1_0395 family protein [Niveibacterium sp. 24ML]|uniref:putative metalloprotease CJM1_0395 family protein n=1 Tax=Niveibacterium sp. 24ML TaxID=2985512 RepID=UPI0022702178|nr:putative metalloprotease CJM1_0395 family protein [Niveibacterium sp. 24ML]MCX9156691.1 putative metalloprotease CJM1_0395 family protein [Niveibacterium sp. 24ML]